MQVVPLELHPLHAVEQQVTDALLSHLGFMPGERVHISVDYTKRHTFIRQAFLITA